MSKIDPTRPVTLRSGEPVKILASDLTGPYPILGIYTRHGDKQSGTWTELGQFQKGKVNPALDLVQPPLVITQWANIYENDYPDGRPMVFFHESETEAQVKSEGHSVRRLLAAAVPITITVPQ